MHATAQPEAQTTAGPAGSFRHALRVYWEDTDAGGVVFHANYLKFFERARTEWLRALGFSQQQLLQQGGVMFVVADAALRFRRAARLDDRLDISLVVAQAGRASLRIRQQAWRDAELLAEADMRIGCVEAKPHAATDFRPCRIPAALLDQLSSA